MKRLFSLMLILALVGAMLVMPAAAAAADIKILLDGEAIIFPDAQPFADENSRTLVPLRPVAEALGAEVEWVQENQSAVFTKIWTQDDSPIHWDTNEDAEADSYTARITLTFCLSSDEICIETEIRYYDTLEVYEVWSNYVYMDTKLVAKDGRVFAPVRYVAENLLQDVIWEGAASAVNILPLLDYAVTGFAEHDEEYFYLLICIKYNEEYVASVDISSATVHLQENEEIFANLEFYPVSWSEAQADSGFAVIIEEMRERGYDTPIYAAKSPAQLNDADFYLHFNIHSTKINGAEKNSWGKCSFNLTGEE